MPNPTDDAERPRVEHQKMVYRTPLEMAECLKVCKNRFELCLISVLIDSGCRIGELGRHVDKPDKYPGLYGCDVGENYINVRGKTGFRRHRLDAGICLALRELAGGDEKPVFKRSDGLACAVSHLAWNVRCIVKRAGIKGKKLGPHSFRHGSATIVARATKSDLAVKSVLAHDTIATSHKYIHEVEDDIADGISPLAIVETSVFGRENGVRHEQLLLSAGSVEVVEEADVVEKFEGEVIESRDLVSELFPEIHDGVEIRPLLRVYDLSLIREIFIEFARIYRGDNRVYRSQELMKRMLRRSGRSV